jgi:uncharacterized protein
MSVYHEGEQRVQRRMAEEAIAERNGVVIGPEVHPGAGRFLAQQSLAVVSWLDGAGRVRLLPWFGEPGFLSSDDGRLVAVDPERLRTPLDPEMAVLAQAGVQVGVVVIDLGTRRRLRLNGRLRETSEGCAITVEESYPNCPKYIQRRHLRSWRRREGAPQPELVSGPLESAALALVETADTLFLGTVHEGRGLDASHRGGEPGFARWVAPDRLRVPDYPGNAMYNSLGNLELDPRAAVLVLDFEHGRALELSGRATLGGRLAGEAEAPFWELEVEAWRLVELPLAWEWELLDRSPFNLPV